MLGGITRIRVATIYKILFNQRLGAAMQADFVRSEFVETLKSLGAEKVREKLSRGEWLWPANECAEEWLRHEDNRTRSEADARAEAREEENLSISRKALRNSERATRIAISAIVLSISMAILEIIKWHSKN